VVATLFSETGILPLRFRRVLLAIAYLVYLLRLPHNHYVHAAMQESKSLLRSGFPCWIADLNCVVSHLPGALPCDTHVEDMDIDQLLSLQKAIVRRCDDHLDDVLMASIKCSMIRGRLELSMIGGRGNIVRRMHHYLELTVFPRAP
jgi:hypothetical protein